MAEVAAAAVQIQPLQHWHCTASIYFNDAKNPLPFREVTFCFSFHCGLGFFGA